MSGGVYNQTYFDNRPEEKEREGGNQEIIRKHWDNKVAWEDKIDKLK